MGHSGDSRRTRLVPVTSRTEWAATRALLQLAAVIAASLLLLAH
jgi:hypothetical protein